jgi:hypothetical protein
MPPGRGARGARTRPGDDGNLMQADGNSFPVFILGWTIGGMNLDLTPALTCFLSPRRGQHANGFWLVEGGSANPVVRIFRKAADDSPSPWGEGRDEGGREPFEFRMPTG